MELTKIRHITIYICEVSKLDATFTEVICSFKLWGEILEKKTGIIFMSLILFLNPQAVLAVDLLRDIIEKIHHSWPQGPQW